MLANRPVSPGLIFVVFCLCVEGQSEGATVTADVLLQDGKSVPSFLAGVSVGGRNLTDSGLRMVSHMHLQCPKIQI